MRQRRSHRKMVLVNLGMHIEYAVLFIAEWKTKCLANTHRERRVHMLCPLSDMQSTFRYNNSLIAVYCVKSTIPNRQYSLLVLRVNTSHTRPIHPMCLLRIYSYVNLFYRFVRSSSLTFFLSFAFTQNER